MYLPFPVSSARSRVVRHAASAVMMAGAVTAGGAAWSATPAYQQLSSAPLLQPVKDRKEPLQYRRATADFRSYSKLVIDPVTIYSGPDEQFGSVSAKDRQIIADYMRLKFIHSLGKTYRIVDSPEPGAARLHLTLTGLSTSTPVLSTLSHLAPAGIALNAAKETAGAKGSFMGSVAYAVELSDASTGELVYAYVTKESAKALDVTASVGELDAAKSGVRSGAHRLEAELTKAASPRPQPVTAPSGAAPSPGVEADPQQR